mgnify:CR=1 FL=1
MSHVRLTSRAMLIVILCLLGLALFSAGQAVTFAWLSAFPDRVAQLESLTMKFWIYTSIAVVAAVGDLFLLARYLRR